jgi:hypothetical protein
MISQKAAEMMTSNVNIEALKAIFQSANGLQQEFTDEDLCVLYQFFVDGSKFKDVITGIKQQLSRRLDLASSNFVTISQFHDLAKHYSLDWLSAEAIKAKSDHVLALPAFAV